MRGFAHVWVGILAVMFSLSGTLMAKEIKIFFAEQDQGAMPTLNAIATANPNAANDSLPKVYTLGTEPPSSNVTSNLKVASADARTRMGEKKKTLA